MSCMYFSPHLNDVLQLERSLYFKIIKGWSTVILNSTMGMACPFMLDVELHCVVNCGFLAVSLLIIIDR